MILQQTCNLWSFTSWVSNISCIRSALLLVCSPKSHEKIEQFLKWSRFNVHMLPFLWFLNLSDNSQAKLMNAIDIFYFQYWLNIHAKEMFRRHLALLNHFDFERFIGLKNSQVKIPTFHRSTLFFKIIMQNNHVFIL